LKRIIAVISFLLLLTGCSKTEDNLNRAMALRAKLLACQGVRFDTVITADYGDKTYTFSLNCQTDAQGTATFQVKEPESLAGITGTVSASGGKLTFDNTALAFELMADGQFSPVCGPWLLIQTLRSGYLTSCAVEGDTLRVAIDDSHNADALHLDIWLNSSDAPIRGDILWQGRRILSLSVSNFTFL